LRRRSVFFTLLKDLIVDELAYHVGFGSLWVITLGRYPQREVPGGARTRIALFGWVVLTVVLCLAVYWIA
jgi:hypothetical protein